MSRVRVARAVVLFLAVLVGSLVVTGCSVSSSSNNVRIDPDKVEKLALVEVARTGAMQYEPRVNCPPHIKSRKDAVSYCRATFTIDGKEQIERVRVTAVGKGGQVHVLLIPRAKGAYFEQEIAQIANKKHIALQRVTCPAAVERIKGETFTCHAIVAGKAYVLKVEHIDEVGGIRILSSRLAARLPSGTK